MTQQLLAKPAKKHYQQILQKQTVIGSDDYLLIFNIGNNASSDVYVSHKKKFGASVGIDVRVIEDDYLTAQDLITDIKAYNKDDACKGMIIQLPLPDHLYQQTDLICANVDPIKDVDGLGGVLPGLSQIGVIDFLPATPGGVMSLLSYYELDNFKGKTVALLGQSNLFGKPLAPALMNRGATVLSCNSKSPQDLVKSYCQKADYIIVCTGVIHLIDQSYIGPNSDQIIIDVGYGHLDGKAVGDVNYDAVVDKVKSITPVPGGVGPMTVVQIFLNMVWLQQNKETIQSFVS